MKDLPMDCLILSFEPDHDGTGELHGRVQGTFCGSGSAWFTMDDLHEFASRLAAYPIDPKSAPALAGGYWGERGELKETHLSIQIAPHDRVGALRVTIQLMEPAAGHEHRARSVNTWFVVGYNDIARFGASFTKVIDGLADEAKLTSSLDV